MERKGTGQTNHLQQGGSWVAMSQLLRSFQRSQHVQPDPKPEPSRSSGPARQEGYFTPRHATADFTEADDDDDDDSNEEGRPRYQEGAGIAGSGNDDDDDDDDNEDGLPQSGTVLPLYSSTRLGMLIKPVPPLDDKHLTNKNCPTRLTSHLLDNPCDSNHRPGENRDHSDMGAIEVAPGLSVPCEANAGPDPCPSLLHRDLVCPHGELPPIREGAAAVPGKCRD